ncbi:MAG: DUF1353 domain-containing protein [Verrucomicrobiota bacterium]|nr:DUF1353 domain-containing protein [Verrucomicrobiota bacterium]
MPAPGSEIPGSAPRDLVARAQTAAAPEAVTRALFKPSVSEADFIKHFPKPYRVRALTIYEAMRNGWVTDRSYWEFLDGFQFVSTTWGAIEIPKGFHTDFASVPPSLHGVIDDDSPIMLFPSAAHDFLFTKRPGDGTRGWLQNGKQLSLTEVNHVLTEAMAICGANTLTQQIVFAAVELANGRIRNEFAH